MINELRNWTEVVKGFFIFKVSHNIWYEIHVMYHDSDFIFDASIAELYVVGNWVHLPENVTVFERNKIITAPLSECIKKASDHQCKLRD